MTSTLLIRTDTTVNTNVKHSKVFALAFVKNEGVTNNFTESNVKEFVIPKLNDPLLLGSAIVQLDSVTSGKSYHSGRGSESFTGMLTRVFSNEITDASTTDDITDIADGVHVYFLTVNGLNETAMRIHAPTSPSY